MEIAIQPEDVGVPATKNGEGDTWLQSHSGCSECDPEEINPTGCVRAHTRFGC